MKNLLAVGLAGALAVACAKAEPVEEPGSSGAAPLVVGGCHDLWAGQNTDVGQVCVWSDGTTLFVEYGVVAPWAIKETHTWVGTTQNYPAHNGNPPPGQFPYASGPISLRTYTQEIPLSEIDGLPGCGDWIYLLAHAALRNTATCQEETGWAEGTPIHEGPGNWAMLAHLQIGCVEPPAPPLADCETAFARAETGARCFSDVDPSISRWGWTNALPEPLPAGGLELTLYAGAAHCAIDHAPAVGTVTVACVDGWLDVTYDANPGVVLTETQLYLGATALPLTNKGRVTVAPGQYPWSDPDGVYTDLVECDELSGYVIAHAVACGEAQPEDGPVTDPCPYAPPPQ